MNTSEAYLRLLSILRTTTFEHQDVPAELRDCFMEVETKCGAPWERVVEKVSDTVPESWNGSRFDDGKNLITHPNVGRREDARTQSAYPEGSTAKRLALLRQQARENGGEYQAATKTVGWQPTCECHRPRSGEPCPEPIPCTVLDPFAGSGTTGQVALELGRGAVLIELNPAYIPMIRARCDVTPGLALA